MLMHHLHQESLHDLSIKDSCIIDFKSKERANLLGLTGAKPEAALFRVGGYLKKGGAPKDVTAQVLGILAEKCQPPIHEDQLLARVDKAYQGQEDQDKSLAQAIKNWVLLTSGDFMLTEVDKDLGLLTRVDKLNRSKIFERLCKDGLVERASKRRGHFRLIDRTTQPIDWRNAEVGGGLPVRWPLDLQDRFEVMPGSVVIVAGESNSGKTAWMLATAQLNLGENWPKIHYFASSNEVNERTLKKRIVAFDLPDSAWDGFEAQRPIGEFQDVIDPDGFNLIDYLEVHADFYEIGGKIAGIAEKLRGGIAVIALQKNPGQDYGRGGAMTLDKASAYLALHRGDVAAGEAHTLKFPKLKYPLQDYASKPIRFKLAGGCRFIRA